MLILTRKLGESVVIGEYIVVTVSDIKNCQIKLDIKAPKNVTTNREDENRDGDYLFNFVQKQNKERNL